MSSSYQYAGQAFQNTLNPLKGWYFESALDIGCRLSTNVNLNSAAAVVHAGLVVHGSGKIASVDPYGATQNGPGLLEVEMGCGAGHGPPIFLWSGNNEPDIINPGVPAGVPVYGNTAYGAPDQVPVFPRASGEAIPGLVGLGGFELESTAFDTAQTFTTGQPLRAVTSNTDANGGKMTNQGATANTFTTAQTFLYGLAPNNAASALDTVVGWVSRGTYTNAYGKPVLAFWSDYIPGTR